MAKCSQKIKIGLVSAACAFFTSGCVHDAYYVPAKQKSYTLAPSFASASPSSTVSPSDPTTAYYSSSHRVETERYKDPNVLGNLHLKTSDDARDEGLKFAIRKEHRSYTAETPIGESFEINGHKVTPNFALGVHKDHKGMAGLVFRMPF